MRRVRLFPVVVILLILVGVLVQCSKRNKNAVPLTQAGKHLANWVIDHQAAYTSARSQCIDCHGPDLRGGISKVSCFSAEYGGAACHATGPVGRHESGWRVPSVHGTAAKSEPGAATGFYLCGTCHGADFSGGVVGVSCFSAAEAMGPCHVTNGVPVRAPHSPLPWRTYPAPTHTDTVDDAAGSNAAACALCHTRGANLRTPIITTYNTGKPGCMNSTLCHGQTGHPADWAQPVNHGSAAKANLNYCQQCHADNPAGGPGSNPRFDVQLGRLVDTTNGNTGCEVCHAPLAPHPRVLQIPASFGTITMLNPLNTPWYLHCKADNPSGFASCNRCHGANLDGVGAAAGATACTFCHRSGLPTTLKNCTSCHAAPPSGAVYPNINNAHLSHAALNVADLCAECHEGLGSVTLDHFLRSKLRTTSVQPGAVRFGAFAQTGGAVPAYNDANLQCTNIYCHGATLSGGANTSPQWNDPAYLTAAGCGTCHGFPPPTAAHTGFTSSTVCKNCHTHVNSANTGFDDPSLHVNGGLDVAGGAAHAFPFPGSAHTSAAGTAPFAGCVTGGCHGNGGVIGVYPVAVGTPPDCRACHTKAGPGNSCGSCHGNASVNTLTAGRPNGNAFPDVAGRHASPHSGFACSLCHGTNGTGNANHGPGNRIAHGDADVNIQFTGEAAGMVFTRSGLNNGRGTCSGSCHGETHNNDNW